MYAIPWGHNGKSIMQVCSQLWILSYVVKVSSRLRVYTLGLWYSNGWLWWEIMCSKLWDGMDIEWQYSFLFYVFFEVILTCWSEWEFFFDSISTNLWKHNFCGKMKSTFSTVIKRNFLFDTKIMELLFL